jgi:hypothetical protein
MTRLREGSGAAAPVIAAIAAIALAAFGVVKGTWAVGGSDSSCYGLMAKTFAAGDLRPSSRLATAPWPDSSTTFAPAGFIPSPVQSGAAAPICSPGMSLLMAPLAALFGRDAIFWLVPISGAVLVWSAFLIARGLAGGAAGATAAVLTATSPIVLFQVVQPMNDVLAAALWIAALTLLLQSGRPIVAGIIVGVAILVRPNLAPLALILLAAPVVLRWPQPVRAAVLIASASLPGVMATLWLNYELYGNAIASGYGSASELFSVANAGQNLSNFGRALLHTQYLVPLVGLIAPIVFTEDKRRVSIVLLLGAALVAGIYLLYQPYPEWWYLRFLMPSLVLLIVLASAAGVTLASRARMGGVVPIVAVLLAILWTRTASQRQALDLQRLEGRYRDAASLVTERLPGNAVLITVWQSGSMRFHADREIVMWDALDPAWLDRAVIWLREHGHQPYLLFERREEPEFRARFRGHSELGGLDWPARLDLNRQVRVYDPADRARFLAGERYQTENIRPR